VPQRHYLPVRARGLPAARRQQRRRSL